MTRGPLPYGGLTPGATRQPVAVEFPGIRITREPDDDFPRKIAKGAARKLADAWWPRASASVRERRARYLADEYPHKMGLLFMALKRDAPRPLPWRVLIAVRPWPCPGGVPTPPMSALKLLQRERELLATADHTEATMRELAAIHLALGATRRKRVEKAFNAPPSLDRRKPGAMSGVPTPALAADVVRLARAVSTAIPDRREVGGHKPGIYRKPVLDAVHEILFALSGTRIHPARLAPLIQEQTKPRET